MISDRKLETNLAGRYSPQLISYGDYYPFGYPIEARSSTGDYRFGFNGQEKDNEIYGEGKSYTAEFWQYDARLGRRWNVDPKLNPMISPYATFANNPIWHVDPDGMEDSPYYDTDGNLLGVDEKGFKGNIYVTTKEAFDKSAKNGVADSKTLQADKNTKEIYSYKNRMNKSAVDKILNNVVSGIKYPDGKKRNLNISYNKDLFLANAVYNGYKDGVYHVEFNASDYEWTVENIRGVVGIHEVWGHGAQKYNMRETHYKAYLAQIQNAWSGTTENYRKHVANLYIDLIPIVNGKKDVPRSIYDIIKPYLRND